MTRLLYRFYDGDHATRWVWTLFVCEGWASEVLDAGHAGAAVRAA